MTNDALLFAQKHDARVTICGNEFFASYPRKVFLGAKGLFAHHTTVMISGSEFGQLREVVEAHFDLNTISPDQEAVLMNADGTALKLGIRQEFNGLVIEMITNSKALLESLDASFKAPSPPWVAFPNMEPIEAVMSKQGSLEYWWEWIWSPFWHYAPADIRVNYLTHHKASEEWAECLAEQPLAPTDHG